MNIRFAAYDLNARSQRVAYGSVNLPPAQHFSMRRRPAHMPWWLAMVGGIGIGFSSASFWSDAMVGQALRPEVTIERVLTLNSLPAAAPVAIGQKPTANRESNADAIDMPQLTTKDAVSLPQPSPRQTLMRAQSAARVGDFAAAIVGYNKVLANDPENREALNGKAFALQQSGAPTEAAIIWARLYQSDPNDQTALANLAAVVSDTTGAPSRARPANAAASGPGADDIRALQEDWEQAQARNRHDPISHLQIAMIADRHGDAATALAFYRQVLADPIAAETLLPMPWTAIQARAAYLKQQIGR